MTVWQGIAQAREIIENYRTRVGVADAVTTSGPDNPHPSTRGRVPTDAARKHSWAARIRERLPEWKGGQTTGFGYDHDGTELHITSVHPGEQLGWGRLISSTSSEHSRASADFVVAVRPGIEAYSGT